MFAARTAWGSYEVLFTSSTMQIKRLVVDPGKGTSLQRHSRRAEIWTVMSGVAQATVGDQTTPLGHADSIYVPVGTWHRLANESDLPLEVIEIQTGTYFGEDDIERKPP